MQHEPAFARTQEAGVLAVVHRDFSNGNELALFERLGEQRVGTASGFLRQHVIRGLEIDGVHIVGFHEFKDLHGLSGLRLDLLDLVGLDDDVFVFAEFVALHDLAALDHDVFDRADVLLLDALLVGTMQHVKRDAGTARAREQPYGHGNETES